MTDIPSPIPHHMKVKRTRLAPAESIRRIHHLTLEGGRSTEENMALLARPEFLSLVGDDLQALDRLEVVSDDMDFYAELVVLRANATDGVVLRPLRGIQLDSVDPRDTVLRDKTGMRAEYKGPHRKWCVFRGADVLAEKLQTEQAAFQWINNQTQAHRKDAQV